MSGWEVGVWQMAKGLLLARLCICQQRTQEHLVLKLKFDKLAFSVNSSFAKEEHATNFILTQKRDSLDQICEVWTVGLGFPCLKHYFE